MIVRGMKEVKSGMRWNTIDEFIDEHHEIIKKIVRGVFRETKLRDTYYDSEDQENKTAMRDRHLKTITRMSFQLWKMSRVFSNRSVVPLCFDCCYLMFKLSGNRVSIAELEMVGLEELGNPVTALKWRKERWFESEKGKKAILEVLALECPYYLGAAIGPAKDMKPSFLQLYEDLVKGE